MTLIVFGACLSVVFAVRALGGNYYPATDIELARIKGSPKAELHIIGFSDFECPACANGAKILDAYLKMYPQKIYFEARYFPLIQIHRYSLRAATYAQCAARQNRFWPVHDQLFQKQSEWKDLLNVDVFFMGIARNAKLDEKALESCLMDPGVQKIILKDREEGRQRGVKSTPTYFINGQVFVGPKSLEDELSKYFGKKTVP